MIYCIERFPHNDVWVVSGLKLSNSWELYRVDSWYDVDYYETGYEVHVCAGNPVVALSEGVLLIEAHLKKNGWRKDFGQL